MKLRTLGIMTMAAVSIVAAAQQSAPAPTPLTPDIPGHADWPQANPADVSSPKALVNALYDVISGPAGKQRDWHRFRSLFLPSGRLGVIRPDVPAKDGK